MKPTISFRILLVALSLTAAACGSEASKPSATSGRDPGPLARFETIGGLCPEATCRMHVQLDRDGTVWTGLGDVHKVRVLDPGLRARLTSLVEGSDYRELTSVAFKGTCPTAYDGQETRYTFFPGTGRVTFSSCDVALDLTDPLFVTLAQAIDPGAT